MVHFHSDEERDHYALIGRYVRLWAGLETNIAYTIAAMYESLNASEIEPVQPLALKRRIKFLKKAFKRMPALADEAENAIAICEELEREMRFRHDLIHGRMTMGIGPNDVPMSRIARATDATKPFGDETFQEITSEMLAEHYHTLGYAGLCFIGLDRLVLDLVKSQNL